MTTRLKPNRCSMLAACLALMETVVLLTVLTCVVEPAHAQSWTERLFGRSHVSAPQQRFQPAWRLPWQRPQQQFVPQELSRPVDFTKAPPPRKQETPPTTNVLVMGDSMADWLAYGLEDAFSETPEIGVIRKPRANTGLLRNDFFDWPAAARDILAAEKADFVVVMIGLGDRQAIRDRQTRGAASQRQAGRTQPPPARSAEQPPEQPADDGQPSIAAAEASIPAGSGYEFRSDKWAEFYGKRIDDMIAVLKNKGVPVFWVGLPSIRGTRSTADAVYLNDLYRSHAEKAGIVYVDVWDGFVDEAGNFAAQGPDFEGQIRLLRAGDGVHFTKAGARKLAHYVEREINRVLATHGVPVAKIPTDERSQRSPDVASGDASSRVAGPIVSLTAAAAQSETLLGNVSAQAPSTDPTVNRVLVRGEALAAPTGRADNFAWPRPGQSLDAGLVLPREPAEAALEPLAKAKLSPPAAKPNRAKAAPPPKPQVRTGPAANLETPRR